MARRADQSSAVIYTTDRNWLKAMAAFNNMPMYDMIHRCVEFYKNYSNINKEENTNE